MNQVTIYLSTEDYETAMRGGVVTVDFQEATFLEIGSWKLAQDIQCVAKLNACGLEKNFSTNSRRLMISVQGQSVKEGAK